MHGTAAKRSDMRPVRVAFGRRAAGSGSRSGHHVPSLRLRRRSTAPYCRSISARAETAPPDSSSVSFPLLTEVFEMEPCDQVFLAKYESPQPNEHDVTALESLGFSCRLRLGGTADQLVEFSPRRKRKESG